MRVHPKKSLGQNFLRSPSVARAIAETACEKGSDVVFEIGPGEGALTDELLKRARRVVAIEKDTRLIAPLKKKYAHEIKTKKLSLIEGDTLSTQPWEVIGAPSYVVAANIPYYITGAIIRHLFSAKIQPKRIVLLVQREVAERIVARDHKESILSVSVKIYGTPRIIKKVPAGAFHPRPSVDSAVLLIENIKNPFAHKTNEKKFFIVLKRGFAHKRKLLRKNLDVSAETLADCNIIPDARPEIVTKEQWLCLSKKI